jgi:hypothetical protein
MKMMLGNPCGIEAGAFRVPDLLRGKPISVRRGSGIQKPREEA